MRQVPHRAGQPFGERRERGQARAHHAAVQLARRAPQAIDVAFHPRGGGLRKPFRRLAQPRDAVHHFGRLIEELVERLRADAHRRFGPQLVRLDRGRRQLRAHLGLRGRDDGRGRWGGRTSALVGRPRGRSHAHVDLVHLGKRGDRRADLVGGGERGEERRDPGASLLLHELRRQRLHLQERAHRLELALHDESARAGSGAGLGEEDRDVEAGQARIGDGRRLGR